MAMHASRLTQQDQNLISVHFDGVMINESVVQKNNNGGGLGRRKALNDISNSRKPSALQPLSKKHNTKNLAANPVSGRKALADLTNSAIPSSQKYGLSQQKQAIAIAEEGFLHNHDECIKAQKKSAGLNGYLKTIGLDEDECFQSVSACNNPPKDENAMMMIFEMDEILEPITEDRPHRGLASPVCGSPDSLKLSYMKDYDDFPSFVLTESPKRSK